MFIWNNMLFVNAFGMFWVLVRYASGRIEEIPWQCAHVGSAEWTGTAEDVPLYQFQILLIKGGNVFSRFASRVPFITNAFGSNDTRHCVRIVEMESFCHVTPLEANAQISRSALSASPMNYGHLNDRPSIPSRCITSLWNFHFMLLNIKLQM